MRTDFTLAQLACPDIAESNRALRACVHCGLCTSACPTYLLTGDELDGPRGRIYLIKAMLEDGGAPAPAAVHHLDRCLSCLACVRACPSGVDYMHLIDHARRHVERSRPAPVRWLRGLLVGLLMGRWMQPVLAAARLARPLAQRLPGFLGAAAALVPARRPRSPAIAGLHPAQGPRRRRVALLTGCVQRTVAPQINAATLRLLTRHGADVIVAPNARCCGALAHHAGRVAAAKAAAGDCIGAWSGGLAAPDASERLDAIVLNASGCGALMRDYGNMFRNDPKLARAAADVAARVCDVSQVVADLGLRPTPPVREDGSAWIVACHAPCSLQHADSQYEGAPPGPLEAGPELLRQAGFEVRVVQDTMCCGSAGIYNLLQPAMAERLRRRLLDALLPGAGAHRSPHVIASANVGCIVHLAGAAPVPVVHVAELLDWATGGPPPAALHAGVR